MEVEEAKQARNVTWQEKHEYRIIKNGFKKPFVVTGQQDNWELNTSEYETQTNSENIFPSLTQRKELAQLEMKSVLWRG